MVSELVIIEKCLEGDKRFEKLLYKKYSSTMLGVCARYFRYIEEEEDVLQEGFIKVFSNLKQFKGEGSFEGWIKKIMINTALNSYRSNTKHYFQTHIEDIENTYANEYTFDENLSAEVLLKLIQELPEGYRIVFNLYAIDGYNHKEIADMLQISEGTSKSQLSRARSMLQKKILSLD